MSILLRRVAFGIFWGGIFWLAFLVIGGGIAGAAAGAKSAPPNASFQQGFNQGHEVGVVAGVEFRERYGTWVLIGAAALATVCTVAGVLPGTRRN